MNFSWAMDLDPKGANNQIKEVIDKQYANDDDEVVVHLDPNDSNSQINSDIRPSHNNSSSSMDAEDEGEMADASN